jgi:hypothetical protein
LAIAKRVVEKVMVGHWGSPLRTIGLCAPKGPERALAPYTKRKDDVGAEAKRIVVEILRQRGER